MFFLFLENSFARAAWNLFDFGNKKQYHLTWQNNIKIPVGSFQCPLEGGKDIS